MSRIIRTILDAEPADAARPAGTVTPA
jgi:hypothetical protein